MKIGELNRAEIEALAAESIEFRDPLIDPRNGDGDASYYKFLFLLARNLAPCFAVELGTWRGFSAMCLAEGNAGGTVLTIDVNHGELQQAYRRSNVEYAKRSSLELGGASGVSILFIDTDHVASLARAELKAWRQAMLPGSIVLFDDIHLNGSMEEFWGSLEGEKFELPLHSDAGFGCLLI